MRIHYPLDGINFMKNELWQIVTCGWRFLVLTGDAVIIVRNSKSTDWIKQDIMIKNDIIWYT